MSWKLAFARDSTLWQVCFWLGALFVALTNLITSPADYGIGPVLWRWMQLISTVMTIVSGKLGLSPLASQVKVEAQGRLL